MPHVYAVDSHDIDLLLDEKRTGLVHLVMESFPALYTTRQLAEAAAAVERRHYEADCDGEPVEWVETHGEDGGVIEWATGDEESGFVVRITPLALDPDYGD